MCQNHRPPNGVIEVKNGISCISGMRKCGMVEVGDADAHTYRCEPTECELSAGAEPGVKRKWRKLEHSGAIKNGLHMMLALSFPSLVRSMPPGHQLTTTVSATAVSIFSAICSTA
eukprot:2394434-Karenia_brevis.AAC.1